MPTWVVTGGSGFLGRHLLDRLGLDRPDGVELACVGRRRPEGWAGRFEPADFDRLGDVECAVASTRPDVVFHLAGRTPPASADDFYRSNTLATLRWLDALRALGRPARMVLVGSAAELGPVDERDLPVGEGCACRPAEAYGMSKYLATCAALACRPPVEVVVARVFNPIGPGLPGSQALGRFARELAAGSGPMTLRVGPLEARRDFVDARDVAGALIALATRGVAGRAYHIGTGRSESVRDGLDRLIALSGRSVEVVADPSIRGLGPSDSRADVALIRRDVGWSASTPWAQSLADLWAGVSGAPTGRD